MKIAYLACLLLALVLRPAASLALPSQKTIKDQGEYNAYMDALKKEAPAQKAAAMDAFVQKYPSSVMKIEALEQAMAAYQAAGNPLKVEEFCNRILQIDPVNVRALAIATYIKRFRTKAGDAEAVVELRRLAERGVQALPQWRKPEGMTEEEFAGLGRQMSGIFYGAAAFGALQQKDFASARTFYLKCVALNPDSPQEIYQLGIASLSLSPMQKDGFWYLAKALNLARGNPPARQSIADYALAKYRSYHGGEDGWEKIVADAASQTSPPPGFADAIAPIKSNHEDR